MFENEKEFKLSELVDVKFLQEFQDTFAKAMNVASITVDRNGPITQPSKFQDFCHKYTRESKEGFKRCNNCDIKWGDVAAREGMPVIYSCHAGLTDFAVPIIVEGIHLGTILGGQIFLKKPNEDKYREFAKEIDINDEEGYIKALNEVSVGSLETIKAAAKLLYLASNAISEIGLNNLKLLRQSKKENFFRNIMETIRNSMDFEETKSKISMIIGKTLKADRCFIMEYDENSDKLIFDYNEYLSSNEISTYQGLDINEDIPNYLNFLKNNIPIIINDGKTYVNSEYIDLKEESRTIEKYGIKNSLGFPLFLEDKLQGALIIHHVKEPHEITDEEIDLMSIIAHQISLALQQTKLYKITKLKSKREKLLKDLVINTRELHTVEETKKEITITIGAALECDRCFILDYCPNSDISYPIQPTYEFTSSESIKSMLNDPDIKSEMNEFRSRYPLNEEFFCSDLKEFLKKQNIPMELINKYYEKYNVKSCFGIPITYGNKNFGKLIMHFTEKKSYFPPDYVEFIKTLANQIGVIIHQSTLYEENQRQASRERMNRHILEILRSSLDKNTIKKLFVKSIGEYFKADRVLFADYDERINNYLPVDEHSEYLSGSDIKSFIGFNLANPLYHEYITPLCEKQEFLVYNWEEYINTNKKSQDFIDLFEDGVVKSSYSIPVIYLDRIMGFFCIEFTHSVHEFSEDELDNIRNICNQAAIALYQAELYIKAQESARTKGEFLANMSHEIKTPLNIIIGFSEILTESNLDKEKEIEYLSNITNSGKHLLELTNDIINISKIEAGNIELKFEKVNSEKLIAEVVSSIQLFAAGKEITIKSELSDIELEADKKMLTQIMYNLLINAIKFTQENGCITITSRLQNENLIIAIEDNGIGIEEINHDVVFEKFKQIDSSFTRKNQGAGLGLSITKKLIELHNGNIYLESCKNKGSKFWFTLPKAKLSTELILKTT